eukprot:COSAG01_NODE_6599_length_3586_cov_264.457126_2_plen_88_part_00
MCPGLAAAPQIPGKLMHWGKNFSVIFGGGVFARDTLPAIHSETRAYVVNTDHAPRPDGSGKGVHWVACLDMHGNRYFNDPLGHHHAS